MTCANFLKAVLVAISLSACTTSLVPGNETQLSNAIGDMSFQRELAEIYVPLAVARAQDNPERLRVIQEKYGRAAALANSFIDRIEVNLVLRTVDENQLRDGIPPVIAAVKELYAELAPRSGSIDGRVAVLDLQLPIPISADQVFKAIGAIFKEARARQDKQIEELKKALESQRWKNWSELKVLAQLAPEDFLSSSVRPVTVSY